MTTAIRRKCYDIILCLYPDMKEFADNAKYHDWMRYSEELDDISNVFYEEEDLQKAIDYLNKVMHTKPSSSQQHCAAVDVATTIESLHPEFFKNVFVYQ